MNFSEDNSEEIVLTSGITITVSAFPNSLYRRLSAKAYEDHPDPEPPKKTVKTLDGDEEVDDLNNADYLDRKSKAELARADLLGSAIIDLSVHYDLEPYEHIIARIEKYMDEKYPLDPHERKMKFLTDYALVNSKDYEEVTWSFLTQMMITEKEVATKIKFFRSEMARAKSSNNDASSSNEIEQLELQPEIT